MAGVIQGDMHRRALTNTSEVNRNAKELLGEEWASNLKILEIPAGESVMDYLTRMVETKEITMDYVVQINDAISKSASFLFLTIYLLPTINPNPPFSMASLI